MVTSTRRLRVSAFAVALTHRTHSQRAIGVMSSHISWISAGAATSAALRSCGTSGSGQSLSGSTSSVTESPAPTAAAFCSLRSSFIQWPKFPSGSTTVWKAWPLMLPRTATCPRDGSSLLAFLGRRTMVDLPTRSSLASNRIGGVAVRELIVCTHCAASAPFFNPDGRTRPGVSTMLKLRIENQMGRYGAGVTGRKGDDDTYNVPPHVLLHQDDCGVGDDTLEPSRGCGGAVEVELDRDEHRGHDRPRHACLVQGARSSAADLQPEGRRVRRAEVDGLALESMAAPGEQPHLSAVATTRRQNRSDDHRGF